MLVTLRCGGRAGRRARRQPLLGASAAAGIRYSLRNSTKSSCLPLQPVIRPQLRLLSAAAAAVATSASASATAASPAATSAAAACGCAADAEQRASAAACWIAGARLLWWPRELILPGGPSPPHPHRRVLPQQFVLCRRRGHSRPSRTRSHSLRRCRRRAPTVTAGPRYERRVAPQPSAHVSRTCVRWPRSRLGFDGRAAAGPVGCTFLTALRTCAHT